MAVADKGIDIRQDANQLLIRAALTDAANDMLTTDSSFFYIYELQDNGTLLGYDFADPFDFTIDPGTDEDELTHRQVNGVDSGLWTKAITEIANFEAGAIYVVRVSNVSAIPVDQYREFQWSGGILADTVEWAGTATVPGAIPAFAADGAGGLPISGAGALDMDNLVLDGLKDAGIIMSRSTIETVTDQTHFIIPVTDDATDDDAYNGATAVFIDGSDPNQRSVRSVTDYDTGTRTVTIDLAPDFTVTGSDTLVILSLATVTGVWNRLLNGATHNIAASAGRRLRGVQAFGDYALGSLWFSSTGTGGQVAFENATVGEPSNSLTDVLAIGSAENYVRLQVAPGSTLTLDATLAGWSVEGHKWTLDLGGESISGSFFEGADVSGLATGASEPHFLACHLGTTSLPPCHLEFCGIGGVLTLTGAGDYFLDTCHSAAAIAVIDFEDAAENKNVYINGWRGTLEIRNFGQAGSTDTLTIVGGGDLILASTCESGTINLHGNIDLTDNVLGGGFVAIGGTINQNARVTHLRIAALHSTTDAKIDTKHSTTDGKVDATKAVLGAKNDAAAAGVPTDADTVMQYVKQIVNLAGEVVVGIGYLDSTKIVTVNADLVIGGEFINLATTAWKATLQNSVGETVAGGIDNADATSVNDSEARWTSGTLTGNLSAGTVYRVKVVATYNSITYTGIGKLTTGDAS